MKPIRPGKDRFFPVLLLNRDHFEGPIALGNGTQWTFEIFRNRKGKLFVRVEDFAAWAFAPMPTAAEVAKHLDVGLGDAGNIADLINDQFALFVERQGYYHQNLLDVVP